MRGEFANSSIFKRASELAVASSRENTSVLKQNASRERTADSPIKVKTMAITHSMSVKPFVSFSFNIVLSLTGRGSDISDRRNGNRPAIARVRKVKLDNRIGIGLISAERAETDARRRAGND